MKKFISCIATFLLLVISSCTDDFDKGKYIASLGDYSLKIKVDNQNSLSGNGGSAIATIETSPNITWQFLNLPSWISTSDNQGKGPKTITLDIAENPSKNDSRSATFNLVSISPDWEGISISYSVTQQKRIGLSVTNVADNTLTFEHTGGTKTLEIDANLEWEAKCDEDFVSIKKINNNSLSVSVDNYDYVDVIDERIATIKFIGGFDKKEILDVKIIQKPESNKITTIEKVVEFGNEGGRVDLLYGNVLNGYTITTSDSWITVKKLSEKGQIKISVNVSQNTEIPRTGKVYIYLSQDVTVPKYDITISQKGIDIEVLNNQFFYSSGTDVRIFVNGTEQTDILEKGSSLPVNYTYYWTSMYDMFNDQQELSQVDFRFWDTSKVTDMKNTFYNCVALASVDVSTLETSNVTTMYQMFGRCFSLNELHLESFNTSNVKDMYSMFGGCTHLQKLYLSEKWDMTNVENYEKIFDDCGSLSEIHANGCNRKTVDILNSCKPSGCKLYSDYQTEDEDDPNEDGDNYFYYSASAAVSMFVNGTDEIEVLPSGYNIQKKYSFYWTSMYDMFNDQNELTRLDLRDWNTSKVTEMRNAFYHCDALNDIDVSTFNTSKVTTMYQMFGCCFSLTELDLSSFDTSNVTDMKAMFGGCISLKVLYLSDKWDMSKVSNAEKLFDDCGNLKEIYAKGCNKKTIDMLNEYKPSGCRLITE